MHVCSLVAINIDAIDNRALFFSIQPVRQQARSKAATNLKPDIYKIYYDVYTTVNNFQVVTPGEAVSKEVPAETFCSLEFQTYEVVQDHFFYYASLTPPVHLRTPVVFYPAGLFLTITEKKRVKRHW